MINTVNKKLLILGANPETVSLVKKANEMGIYTIVTDYDPNAYAKQYASKAININAVDLDALIEFAKEENIDGVIVGVAESLMPTYQKLCKALNFPCYAEPELIDLMVDKQRFKECCRKYDVPVVDEYFVDFNDSNSYVNVELPVVVKPVDSCSSKGISVCKTYKELEKGIKKALEFSNSKRLLIEKYMTGEEVIIYYTFQDGEPILTAMCDRYTNKEQSGVAQLPTSYIFPSKHLKTYMENVDGNVKNMFKNIGLKHGTIFIQSFVDEYGNVRFYEPGYRLNGAQEHYIVNALTGVDVKEYMINFALNGRMSNEDISKKANPVFDGWGCKLSPLVRLGKIGSIKGIDKISKMPEVISVNPSYKEGDEVVGFGTLKQIVCRFFVVSKTKEGLKKAISNIQKEFDVLDSDGQSMLLTPFDVNIIDGNY